MKSTLFKKLFVLAAASCAFAVAPCFAQVSLRGLYVPSPQTNPPLILWIHDNDTIGVHIFDSTQQEVGFGKTKLSNDSFTITASNGQTVAGSVSGLGPNDTPSITATLSSGGTSTPFTAPRQPIFRISGGGENPLGGRFDGVANSDTSAGALDVSFIIDANNNLYFIESRRNSAKLSGGIGTVTPNSTSMTDSSDEAPTDARMVPGGTFTVSSVQGFTITGSFTTSDFEMRGTFQQPDGSYRFVARKKADAYRLGNISTRGFVNTGDGQLISGFIITGGPKRVLIRALGPSLSKFGVSPVLPDPSLQLFHGNQSIGTDTGWKNNANAAEIRHTGLAPDNDNDSAFLVTLEPGAYTAVVTGASGDTGVALVEVYEAAVF
jgi:hypothetical protein